MDIQINGEPATVPDTITVTELLALKKVSTPDMVSVSVNDEFVARPAFGEHELQPGDRVEFLYFMGGGARGGRTRP